MKVSKRDGRIVDFDKHKIVNAIELAMAQTESGVNHTIVVDIANKVAHEVKSLETVSVEQIQDMVEQRLMASSRKDVAKEYITYRNERTKVRNRDKKIYQQAKAIYTNKNINNDNANTDQHSFSSKENRVGALFEKKIAHDELLSEDVKKAVDNFWIYEHDFDKRAVGSHNCLVADVKKLLHNGFSTRNGDVRPANSVSTAFQLIAVIFQCQSQVR